MAKFGFDAYNGISAGTGRGGNNKDSDGNYKVSFLMLRNDGDEAIVRFAYDSPKQFDIVSCHKVKTSGGRIRLVSCLRQPSDPVEKCPLCAGGNRLIMKFFVKMLVYTQNPDGTWSASAKIWERPASFAKLLFGYFTDYGDLSNIIFKIKRHGAKGSLDTTYDVIYANPKVYDPNILSKDFSAFDDLKLDGYAFLTRTAEELQECADTGILPDRQPKEYSNKIPANAGFASAKVTENANEAYNTDDTAKSAYAKPQVSSGIPAGGTPVSVSPVPACQAAPSVYNSAAYTPAKAETVPDSIPAVAHAAPAPVSAPTPDYGGRPLRSQPAQAAQPDDGQTVRPRRSYTY